MARVTAPHKPGHNLAPPTPVRAALPQTVAWLLHRSPNILLIAGTSRRTHLRENLSVAKLQLATEVITQLDSIGIAEK
jgi:aryl-alcohol dehydrogenase-like predicted oxidoreductase